MSWFGKISEKLRKTSEKINSRITAKKVDQETLDDLEEALITADLGVTMTERIIGNFSREKFGKDVTKAEIISSLAALIAKELQAFEGQVAHLHQEDLNITIVCGVNGNGKTTTIGKLAAQDHANGRSVVIAACDTFRAAAIEQLALWAKRSSAILIQGEEAQDPSSIAYNAVEIAIEKGVDNVYIDTAGRLHNNQNLMEELAKIKRTVQKLRPQSRLNTLLVLDATTGQNALLQVEHFGKIIELTGLIITKLDGTAKAGVLLAISAKFKLPIYYIGVGEGIDDLQPFVAEEFARALLGS